MRINHTCTAREMSIIRKYITGLSYKLKMTQDELDSFHKIRTRKQLEKKSYEYIAKSLIYRQKFFLRLFRLNRISMQTILMLF